MRNDATDHATEHRGPVTGVVRLAPSVLSSELSVIYPDLQPRILVQYLDDMQAALVQPAAAGLFSTLSKMRRDGIRDTDIADFYVPVMARRLGEWWGDDRLAFTGVAAAVSNLQMMLRSLDSSWNTPEHGRFGMLGTICIIVPKGSQHTIGASILAGQMRRAGYEVRLGIDLELSEIPAFVRNPATVGIMVSASSHEPLAFLRSVVKKAREGNGWVPVLIGGSVLQHDIDICAATGADHATTDWQTAVRFCADEVAV